MLLISTETCDLKIGFQWNFVYIYVSLADSAAYLQKKKSRKLHMIAGDLI